MTLQNPERRVYGSTGEMGRDGLLSPEQQLLLDQIQDRAANNGFDALNSRTQGEKFPLIAMATGVGKGRIIHLVIEKELRRKPAAKILIIAGTKNVLVDQTHEALSGYQEKNEIVFGDQSRQEIIFNSRPRNYVESDYFDEETEETSIVDDELPSEKSLLYSTGKLNAPEANVHVATIQSVLAGINRGSIDPKVYDLTIIDEVHNIGTALRLSAVQQFERVIGFTATPHRSSGRMKAPSEYGFEVIESLTLPEAQERRLLPPLVGVQINTEDVVDNIPVTATGQIDFRALEAILKNSPDLRPYIADRVAQIINSDDKNYKTVMAVNFVWEAQELAELLAKKGVKVGIAVNQADAKRIHEDNVPAIDAVDRYKLPHSDPRSVQVLISPYVASEGFDAPFTEVLVWASPTDSALRYTQYTGRLSRRSDGKLFGVVVDCLYQTNQYNWSYNLGMWMKDRVRQLDSGLLYLGPEQDIAKLTLLPEVQRIVRTSEKQSLEELQKTELLTIQDGDFVITSTVLTEQFIGTAKRLVKISKEVINEIREKQPEVLVRRLNARDRAVTVVTNRDLFFKIMAEHGAQQREQAPEYSGEWIFSAASLHELFVGKVEVLLTKAEILLKNMESEGNGLLHVRIRDNHQIRVITEVQKFIESMESTGVKKRVVERKGIEQTDFVISQSGLRAELIGDTTQLFPIINEILAELAKSNPDIVVQRYNGPRIVTVVTDKSILYEKLRERGVKIKSEQVPELKDGEIPVTGNNLMKIFKGTSKRILSVAAAVMEEMTTENPGLVVQRRSTKHNFPAITDRELFIRMMTERGLILQDSAG